MRLHEAYAKHIRAIAEILKREGKPLTFDNVMAYSQRIELARDRHK